MARQEFKRTYYDFTIQRFNNYTTLTSARK